MGFGVCYLEFTTTMRDYVQGKQEEKRRKKAYKVHFIILGIAIVFCIAGIIWFLRSDVYTVAQVTTENIDSVLQPQIIQLANEHIQDRSWISSLFLNTQSLLGFSTYSLAEKIAKTYPILTDISISKNYFTRNVTISARERKKMALWCTSADVCWWFDEAGVVFLEGPSTQGQLINKITSRSSDSVVLGEKIPIQGDISIIEPIFSFLDAIGAPTKNIIWDNDREEIQTDFYAQFPVIYFSTQQNPNFALTEVKKIKNLKNLSYIDLRISNRIFYK